MQRIVYNNVIWDWKQVNKGTIQRRVSGPYIFNILSKINKQTAVTNITRHRML